MTLSALTAAGVATLLFSAANAPAQSVQTQNLVSINGSTGNVNLNVGSSLSSSVNGSSITFGLASNITTALQSAGAYLTTAAQSDHTHSQYINTSQSSLFQHTSATSAITSNAMNTAERANFFATSNNTFANSTHSHGAVAFSGTNVSASFTSQSNGLSVALSAPAQSVQTQNLVSVNGSTGNISLNVGSSLSSSVNGSSITFGLASNITTALQSAGAYLTTAAQSNHSHGNPTLNLTNLSGTTASNSAGFTLSLSAGNYLTTAALSNHSHGNPTLALTNLSGTTASNSAGLTLSLSAAAPGGGVTPVASASNGSFSFTTLGFSNANNVTFGTSAGSIITASVAPPGAAAENNAINLLGANTSGNTTATGSTIGWSGVNLTLSGTNASQVVISAPAVSSLVGVGGISLSTNGSTISISHTGAAVPPVQQYWACPSWAGPANALITNITAINGRPFFMPFKVQGTLSVQELMWNMSRSTSGSNAFTVDVGVYAYSNSSVISLLTSARNGYSQTDTASISGIRQFEANFASFSLTPGDYVLGMLFSANGGNTASMNYSLIGATTANMPVGIVISGSNAYHTYTSHQAIPLEGRYTNTSAALPGTVSQANVIGAFTGASMVLRPNWTLATHN